MSQSGSSSSSEDSADLRPVAPFQLDPDVVLYRGLRIVRYRKLRIKLARKKTNNQRFQSMFGVAPYTACVVFEDMMTTHIPEAKVEGSNLELRDFLIALHFLRKYPKEDDYERIFDMSKGWVRGIIWKYVKKIQALKAIKVVWPEDFAYLDLWVMTVDGTHCWIQELQEPNHPTWSQDSKYYSHKYNKAGMNFELGIALNDNKLLWMNGPFKAGANDMKIFKDKGLSDELARRGQKAIGDGGYSGRPGVVSTPNAYDNKGAKLFKSRALKRHENFNGMTKVFEILSGRFRHSTTKFKCSFEAVCVLCQYKIENETPLYDILIQDVVDKM